MSRTSLRRPLLAALLLTFALAAPTVSAAAPWAGLSTPAPLDLLSRAWGFLTGLWPASKSDSGCIVDPNGQCIRNNSSDIGCGIDPNGQCKSHLESGCRLDPNGQCTSSYTEIGCIIDLDGRCRQ